MYSSVDDLLHSQINTCCWLLWHWFWLPSYLCCHLTLLLAFKVYCRMMTACDDPFKRKLLKSSGHRRVRWRNGSSCCKLYSILPICFFGEGYCQDRVQITCFKNKMYSSLVRRHVNEDDSNFFFASDFESHLYFFFQINYLSSASFSMSLIVLAVNSSDDLFYCFMLSSGL